MQLYFDVPPKKFSSRRVNAPLPFLYYLFLILDGYMLMPSVEPCIMADDIAMETERVPLTDSSSVVTDALAPTVSEPPPVVEYSDGCDYNGIPQDLLDEHGEIRLPDVAKQKTSCFSLSGHFIWFHEQGSVSK